MKTTTAAGQGTQGGDRGQSFSQQQQAYTGFGQPPQGPDPAGDGYPPKKKMKKWMIAVIISVAVLLVGGGVTWAILANNDSPSGPASNGKTASPSQSAGTTPAATKDAHAFEAPVPGAGETLYIGKVSFTEAEDCQVAFILSADKKNIHDVTIYLKKLNLSHTSGGSTATVIDVTSTEKYSAEYPISTSKKTVDLGKTKIKNFYMKNGVVYGELNYVYVFRNFAKTGKDVDVPFKVKTIEFKAQDGSTASASAAPSPSTSASAKASTSPKTSASANTAPVDTAGKAKVEYDKKTYYVSVGEIGKNEEGKTTVKIESAGIGSVLPFKNNKIVIPVQATIQVDGKTYSWKRVTTNTDGLIFQFDTSDVPDKIYVYPADGGYNKTGATAFDGQTKEIIK
ncbi:hypothetical protein LJB83_00685 [Clostridia bacterium OttesenSCG-928-F22]|nr:hypothetical protein [Clostridia bacterium OttesenSCG-928-F22]